MLSTISAPISYLWHAATDCCTRSHRHVPLPASLTEKKLSVQPNVRPSVIPGCICDGCQIPNSLLTWAQWREEIFNRNWKLCAPNYVMQLCDQSTNQIRNERAALEGPMRLIRLGKTSAGVESARLLTPQQLKARAVDDSKRAQLLTDYTKVQKALDEEMAFLKKCRQRAALQKELGIDYVGGVLPRDIVHPINQRRLDNAKAFQGLAKV